MVIQPNSLSYCEVKTGIEHQAFSAMPGLFLKVYPVMIAMNIIGNAHLLTLAGGGLLLSDAPMFSR